MDPTTATADRIRRFLEQEPVVWLSTVRPNGDPHLIPIWFWWDGETLLVFSKPDAQKVRNLRVNPTVMLALGDADADFDIGMVEGKAELLDEPLRVEWLAGHCEKYGDRMAAIGLTGEAFAATYSQVIRIRPVRYLPWHGRTTPASVGGPVERIDPRWRDAIRRVALGLDRRSAATTSW